MINRHIILGPKLRTEMLRESRRLTAQWMSVNHPRRTELARQISAIALLLGEDIEPRIGV
jgi:hypothetical protein